MKSASVRDLHIRTSELVREAAEGEPVAEIRLISKKAAMQRLPDLTNFWKRFPDVPGDSGRFLEEDR